MYCLYLIFGKQENRNCLQFIVFTKVQIKINFEPCLHLCLIQPDKELTVQPNSKFQLKTTLYTLPL